MIGLRQKKSPRASRLKSGIRVLWLAACLLAVVTPRLSAEITLVSRVSEARAWAQSNFQTDSPPAQVQTDFLPANLGNSAHVANEGGVADANSTSSSSIVTDNPMGTLRVTGDGAAGASGSSQNAEANATATLIILNFTLTNTSYSYSMTGQLTGPGGCASEAFETCSTATARLTNGSGTIFEVVGTTLSETGTLPPGTYTLSVDSFASAFFSYAHSDANFEFELDPTSTPTPTPTLTPNPCFLTVFSENFDGVTAPALPAGWSTSFTPGPADCSGSGTCAAGTNWITDTTAPDTSPNAAFHDAPGCVTDSKLDSPPIVSALPLLMDGNYVRFRHSFNFENGFDGGVLEISIDGGPFADIVAAGGEFLQGGYNGTISTGFLSPIAGRAAWTGNSNGYIDTDIQVHSLVGQTVVLRFRVATDCGNAGTGWRIDNISLGIRRECQFSPTPTPTPTPTLTPTPTPTLPPDCDATALEVFFVPVKATAGVPFDFNVAGVCDNGHFAGAYQGTVHFTSTDGAAELPPESGISGGGASFSATLHTLGSWTITATDTHGLTGTSHPIIVIGLPPTPTPTPTPTPIPAAQALNLSTRLRVETGTDNAGIGGFIITGSAPKEVLLRAIGPSTGVADSLADPTLALHGSSGFTTIINDNWKVRFSDGSSQQAEIEGTGIPPSNDLESAIHATLDPGAYTAVLTGNGSPGTGLALVEVYDLAAGVASKLGDISTRALVGTGNDIVIAGFILGSGGGNDRVVVRGLGPSLAASGLSPVLADPTLELRDSNGTLLDANDNCEILPPLAPQRIKLSPQPNPLEPCMDDLLPSGSYTALLSGVNSGTGLGLVEVYDLGSP